MLHWIRLYSSWPLGYLFVGGISVRFCVKQIFALDFADWGWSIIEGVVTIIMLDSSHWQSFRFCNLGHFEWPLFQWTSWLYRFQNLHKGKGSLNYWFLTDYCTLWLELDCLSYSCSWLALYLISLLSKTTRIWDWTKSEFYACDDALSSKWSLLYYNLWP